MQFVRRLAVVVAPLTIVGGIALAAIPAQAATNSPARESVVVAAAAVHSTSHQITRVTPDEAYIWVDAGTFSSEEECELIGLDEFEDGYAADYECEPVEETGVCSSDWTLWLYVPEDLAAVQSRRESAAVPSAC